MSDRLVLEREETIEGGWEGFHRDVVPEDASDIQRFDMRMAFFGGAMYMQILASSLRDMPGEEARARWEYWLAEVERFKHGAVPGRTN